jgi:hypothetical protein
MAFRIALNMAGAVSAGAYTAGVLDFLIQALDAWYDERARLKQLGVPEQSWTVPTHDVVLDVLTGASAGGMCAAISSVALEEEFDHVTQTDPAPDAPVNRLYQSWVRSIDILPLLGTADLPNKQGPVKSILDCTPIDAIANAALVPQPARAKKRPWVADPFGIILTLSNLRGIPYSVDQANQGSFEERVAYHADQIRFSLSSAGGANTDTVYALSYSDPAHPNWQLLRSAAMATGAFPVMLASRVLERTQADYENRLWEIKNDRPTPAGECESEETILPDWKQTVTPTFGNVYADGGVTNNNPFECARQFLADAAGHPSGRNPRRAEEANAAVISVDPFPGDEPFDPGYDAEENSARGNVALALLGTLVNQSRFQGENLKLTKSEEDNSRFAIAPSDDSAGKLPSLLSGSLGAFGGFIDQNFRDRDYQLGRRNCQQFLRAAFMLPEDNPIIRDGVAGKTKMIGGITDQTGGRTWYQLIPLMENLQEQIQVPPRANFKTTQARLEQVSDAAADRLEAVVHAFVNQSNNKHVAWSLLIKAVFDLGGKDKIRDVIYEELLSKLRLVEQV